MYWFYNIALVMYWATLIPMLLYRLIKEEGFFQRIKQSIGYLPAELKEKISNRHAIWLHAASVGEIVATSPIVREIRKEMPEAVIVVSVVTATGYRMARQIIKDSDGLLYFPLDLPYFTNRILNIIRPKIILLVETEIWPNFLRIAEEEKIPVMMVNGRISQRSAFRYRLIHGFTKKILSSIRIFCMQSQVDKKNIIHIGADPNKVTVTGNTKYDQSYAIVSEEEKQRFRFVFGVEKDGGPVMIAGSTHSGEDDIVCRAFVKIREEFPKAKLIIAPRHIFQADQVAETARKYGLILQKRSDIREEAKAGTDGVILDTIGELGRIYSICDLVFVGGSMVSVGGHNILEPAAHGKPIIVGPHMFNFIEIFELLSSRGACKMAQNEAEFSEICLQILRDRALAESMRQSCLKIVEENQGATKRNLEELKRLMREENLL